MGNSITEQSPALAEAPVEFVSAFARGLQVIRAFGQDAERLTLSEVADRAGLTRAGARRLLITLETLGYASHRGRHFFLTPKILSLGFAYTASMPLFPFAAQILERLVEELKESVSLVVLDGSEVVFVFSFPFRPLFTLAFTAGSRLPAHATSAGRLLLGELSDEDLDGYLATADIRPFTPKTRLDPAEIRRTIREDKARGWSWVEGEIAEHVSGIAVPIRDSAGRVVAAVNVSFQSGTINMAGAVKRILPSLKTAADQMSFSLDVRERATR